MNSEIGVPWLWIGAGSRVRAKRWGEEFDAVRKRQKDGKGQRTENNVARLSFSSVQIQPFFVFQEEKKTYL